MAVLCGFLVTLLRVFVVTAENHNEKRSTVCYGDLGCFSTGGAFTSLYRLLNLNPQSPATIKARFMLFTRQNTKSSSAQYLNYNNYGSITSSYFSGSRPTKIISHGFLENGHTSWMADMKDELLRYADYNVVLIDWGGGSGLPYTQATANTRVVGAEVAQLIGVLQSHASARAEDFHLIGHSLGAHICGYAGERTLNLGRISGLDPADPYFQYTDKTVRLDPSDAAFVDVMHTDGASILALGYGMIQTCGHVDYFPNEGLKQPGCDKNPIDQIRLEGDIYNGGKEFVACSHLRAYKYFTESINSRCPFNGYKCQDYASFSHGACLPCGTEGCGYMGFHADKAKPAKGETHVKYFLQTGDTGPFCRYHYQVDVQFGQLPGAKTEKGTLYVNLRGTNGQTGELQLNADLIEVSPGSTKGFMMTSTHDVGDISSMEFRWTTDSHWYNPFTWKLLSSHKLQISSVDIVNGETNSRKRFCGFNVNVDSDVTRSFTKTC